MRTKEETIAKSIEKYMLSIDDISRGTNAIPTAIHSAMDEYAKEVAIDFRAWFIEKDRTLSFVGDARWLHSRKPEELFEIYQQEKSSLK